MKKKYPIFITITLIITAISGMQSAMAHDENHHFVTDLITGQHYKAGDVTVWNDGEFIHVNFTTANGCLLSETHLYIATGLNDIPQHNGNPTPGQFEYKTDHNPMTTCFEYKIKNKWRTGTKLYIAAESELCKEKSTRNCLNDLEASLPDQVTVLATHAYDLPHFNNSYFKITISGGTKLDGTYNGWCVDTDHLMNLNSYLANVYSSYRSIPVSLIEKPYNLDLINYIINQHHPGKPSGCDGAYTYGDVQRAIWELIEDKQSSIYYLGPWSECRVDKIVADAQAHGEGFKPKCNQVVAIILEPKEIIAHTGLDIGQTSIIEVPIHYEKEKCGCETAWAHGPCFCGHNWAMYFNYTVH